MSVPALALAPVLIDPRTGTGANVRTLNDELLDRAARDDYHAWLAGTSRHRRLRPPRPPVTARSATWTPPPARSSAPSTPTHSPIR